MYKWQTKLIGKMNSEVQLGINFRNVIPVRIVAVTFCNQFTKLSQHNWLQSRVYYYQQVFPKHKQTQELALQTRCLPCLQLDVILACERLS